MSEKEIWKDVVGYEGVYEVSNFIKEYPSYREAERETGIKAIDVVCRGDRQKGRKQQTAGGYKWKYKEDVIQD